ncbi:PI-PLC domain-containing protein [Aspergillus glaucus CBS 516.65]|uniref:Phosphatidylinositol-specific phospholipase C X domain-containing protein n=1 Tax=Aspergillus glaucus CBS 516.65 TaxID=1160497 RepID=A0A1L9VHK8_ASPGL|nr:hypothetical protein ASPGLDRAFT_47921 [Aspergillus glaucus CBS 516.65]OJJ83380.1 hypothetical protein ASPGLDRAFT_47921 [Aspergillus glaucus CBS 516.65]
MRWTTHLLPLLLGAILPSQAQDGTLALTNSAFTLEGTLTSDGEVTIPTGEYQTYSSTITLSNDGDLTSATVTGSGSSMGVESATGNASSSYTTTSDSVTMLVGGMHTTVLGNASASATNATSRPTSTPVVNTQPCNGYPEFCAKKYSNVTMVAAHNSPFVKQGNVAANQVLDVTTQLNDGIRMLQFQTHLVNDTMYLCHSSCDLLNMGPLEDYLVTVTEWIKTHPYDVVTILMGNSDYVSPKYFTKPVENSGLKDLVYTPPKIPMALDDWPSMSSMILSGKRAVMFLDYQANQTADPWLMDEFSQVWETPFSPTDREFPCTTQRPPDLAPQDANNRLYIANHNLNLEFNFGSLNLLIPNTALLNETNAVSGYGSLGRMADNCTTNWNRPPNFLLVDYYNYGNFNGSVFEVAAEMNNVTYNGQCCGTTSAASNLAGLNMMAMLLVIAGVQMFTHYL